jgi:hypothetical protein
MDTSLSHAEQDTDAASQGVAFTPFGRTHKEYWSAIAAVRPDPHAPFLRVNFYDPALRDANGRATEVLEQLLNEVKEPLQAVLARMPAGSDPRCDIQDASSPYLTHRRLPPGTKQFEYCLRAYEPGKKLDDGSPLHLHLLDHEHPYAIQADNDKREFAFEQCAQGLRDALQAWLASMAAEKQQASSDIA